MIHPEAMGDVELIAEYQRWRLQASDLGFTGPESRRYAGIRKEFHRRMREELDREQHGGVLEDGFRHRHPTITE